jgi:cytidylate kinase
MKLPVPNEVVEKAISRYEQDLRAPVSPTEAPPGPRVITISRQCGSGGTSIAHIVGERLGWPVWDGEILDILADKSHAHYQKRLFEALDEKRQGKVEATLLSCLGEPNEETYLYLLNKALYIIAQKDAIIVGRSADIVLKDALHVYMTASLEHRVKLMMTRWGLSYRETLKKVKTVDRQRQRCAKDFARSLRKSCLRKQVEYDLVINTDRVSFQGAAAMICEAVRDLFRMRT